MDWEENFGGLREKLEMERPTLLRVVNQLKAAMRLCHSCTSVGERQRSGNQNAGDGSVVERAWSPSPSAVERPDNSIRDNEQPQDQALGWEGDDESRTQRAPVAPPSDRLFCTEDWKQASLGRFPRPKDGPALPSRKQQPF